MVISGNLVYSHYVFQQPQYKQNIQVTQNNPNRPIFVNVFRLRAEWNSWAQEIFIMAT